MYWEQWKVARWLGYKSIEPHLGPKSRLTMFDLFIIPGDPTKEELKELGKKQGQKAINAYLEKKDRLVGMGLISEITEEKKEALAAVKIRDVKAQKIGKLKKPK